MGKRNFNHEFRRDAVAQITERPKVAASIAYQSPKLPRHEG